MQQLLAREVDIFHTRLVTRAVRYPENLQSRHLIPDLIAVPDLPVPKIIKKAAKSHVIPNDGLHFHAFVRVHKSSRKFVQGDLKSHIDETKSQYLAHMRYLQDIYVTEIDHDTKIVACYLVKVLFRKSFTEEDIIILGAR